MAFSSSCKHTRRVEREHGRVERVGGEGGEQDEEDEEAGLVAAPAGGAAREVAQQGLLQKNVGKLAQSVFFLHKQAYKIIIDSGTVRHIRTLYSVI